MIDKKIVKKVLDAALTTSADFAELFMEDKYATSLNLLSKKIQNVHESHERGVGIRVAKGFKRVYGYTNNIDEDSLIKLAKDLAQSFPGEPKGIDFELKELEVATEHQAKIDPQLVPVSEKTELLYRADKAARDFDQLITQVQCRYFDYNQHVWIANTEGTYVKDLRTRTRLSVTAIASNENSKQSGFNGPGGTYGFEFYNDVINVEETAKEAARVAVIMLNAKECPSGKMPVVIDNGFGGVIFHEAVGHSLEATSVAIGASVFTGKKGELIANPLVSAVDDGTIPHGWGSATFDDEGNKQKRRQLIKDGVLTSYMIDKLNAIRMNDQCTSSGRRESYRFAPTSRMSNTFIENGESTFEEIIAATKLGLYAKKMGGGSVNPATGDFNFSVSEAYMIRDGKIAEPVKGASLVGTGREALLRVDMVANNLRREQGMCGSESGSIPADVGQPTIRISEITVGGRGGALK
jgi:TldD protein